ncbi:MAG TPA: adenylate/guanylate cyclase domain-containing protein [Candidatus Binatia bacterium]|nr:adenylate/guanylate cyclase domain-containing protein [Candidatus Binatia bacterium]
MAVGGAQRPLVCTSCGVALIPGKAFCHDCGAPAPARCPQCGAPLAPTFRFCPDCGARVEGQAAPPPADARDRLARHVPPALAAKIRATRGAVDGERKQVTVLFCDLAGSTAIAARLDPEEWHDLLERYLDLAFAEIYRREGIVNQLAGDGLMALFGAPVAHEDAPARAVEAALAIQDAIGRLNAGDLAGRDLALRPRIGVHTGPVVVGTVGNDLKMDYTALGDTTNLASRLEGLAPPGGILISEATERLVRGAFRLLPRGPLAVKGRAEAVPAFEVLGRSEGATPMAIAAGRGLTPFVGRAQELAQLEACYRAAVTGRAQVVAVVGDAGSGKSRLLWELREKIGGAPVTFFEARCSALDQSVPYLPFLTMLRRHFGITRGEPAERACERIAERVRCWDPALDRAHPHLCRLLALPVEEAPGHDAERLEPETFATIARLVHAESERAPVVMLVEDLHWIDGPSRQLLESAVARLEQERVMLVVTHRPDYEGSWRPGGAFTQLRLHPLPDAEATTMIRAVAGGTLPAELERRILDKAEGSPFFTEEITRALVEAGLVTAGDGRARLTRPVEDIHIPGTVQEVVAARLDRLGGDAKRVAQVAAVLGRQFARGQLEELLAGEGIDVGAELEELVRRGVLHRQSFLSPDEFRFGESVTQEVAYESLLLKQRRQLHERVGRMLEASGGAGAEHSALVAHHFARSDDREKAITALLRAAADAERVPSYGTAAHLYRQAWELAEAGLSADAAGRHHGWVLEATRGFCRVTVIHGPGERSDAQRAAERGRTLARALEDPEALAELSLYHGIMATFGDPREFAAGIATIEEALAIAQRAGLALQGFRISRGLGLAYLLDGRFALAERTLTWVVAELEHLGHAERLTDLYLGSRTVRDAVLFHGDDLERALGLLRETHDLAVRAGNRTVEGHAAGSAAQVYFLWGRYAEAREWAERAIAIAEAISDRSTIASVAGVALVAAVERGEPVAAERYLALIDLGLAALGVTALNHRFVLDALLAVGDLERAQRYVAQLRLRVGARLSAAQAALATGRLHARLGPGHRPAAARAYEEAIALAESLGARSLLAAAHLGAAALAAEHDDQPAALRHVGRSLALSQALGLERYRAPAQALAATLGDRGAPTLT